VTMGILPPLRRSVRVSTSGMVRQHHQGSPRTTGRLGAADPVLERNSRCQRLRPIRWPPASVATASVPHPGSSGHDKKGFHTKRKAQAFAATIEVSMMRGEYVAPSVGRHVAELADRYLWLAHVKATTAVARQSAWDHRVGPRWG